MYKLSIIATMSLIAACGVEQPNDQGDLQAAVQPPAPCVSTTGLTTGRVTTARKISAVNGVATGGELLAGAGSWLTLNDGDTFDIPLNVQVGERIEQVAAYVFIGSTVTESLQPLVMSVYRQDSVTGLPTDIGDYTVAETPGSQALIINSPAAPGLATEDVVNGIQTYWVHLRYNQPPAGQIKAQSAVGGITLTTSLPSTSSSAPPSC